MSKNNEGGEFNPQGKTAESTKKSPEEIRKITLQKLKIYFPDLDDTQAGSPLDLSHKKIEEFFSRVGELAGIDLAGALLVNGKFDGVWLDDVNFSNADLRSSSFEASHLENAIFQKTKISGARFLSAFLKGAHFEDIPDGNAYFMGADLENAVLNGNFTGANFSGANLIGADLSRANLTRANLIDVPISEETKLDGVIVKGAKVSGFLKTKLSKAGLL